MQPQHQKGAAVSPSPRNFGVSQALGVGKAQGHAPPPLPLLLSGTVFCIVREIWRGRKNGQRQRLTPKPAGILGVSQGFQSLPQRGRGNRTGRMMGFLWVGLGKDWRMS